MERLFESRQAWREWLQENHHTADDEWLIFYKKKSGKKSISYDDAVEEALCFGWIDSKMKSINADYYILHFTPRRQGSKWSQLNLKRAERMVQLGFMTPAGMKEYDKVLKNKRLVQEPLGDAIPEIPEDLLRQLEKNPQALKNFMNFPQSSRKMFIYWINDAKREETRSKRILRIVENAELNKKSTML